MTHLEIKNLPLRDDLRKQARFIEKGNISEKIAVFWYILISVPIKIKDLIKIKKLDLDLSYCRFTITDEKGDKRYIPLTEKARDAIQRYILKDMVNNEYLFPIENGSGHITRSRASEWYALISEKSGSKHLKNVEDFRSIILYNMIECGVGILEIMYYVQMSFQLLSKYIQNTSYVVYPMREYKKYRRRLKLLGV